MSENQAADYKSLIVGVDTVVPLRDGRLVTAINFDNAATTPPFVSVMQKINDFMPWYSSIHRGAGYKSTFSSDLYEQGRKIIASFVNADTKHDSIIFVKNTTEAINMLSYCLVDKHSKDRIISTCMEHHSNDLPWRDNYKVDYANVDECGCLSLYSIERLLQKHKGHVRLVAVTGASNVTGYINPIYKIAEIAHKYGAKIFVDAAQLAPHSSIDMKPPHSKQHIDFLAFSAHKMYAPFGTGVLIGPRWAFQRSDPNAKGGGTIKLVTHDSIIWEDSPQRNEAGTPNIVGVVALIEAIQTICKIGMQSIEAHERALTSYVLEKLNKIPDLHLYGNIKNCENRLAIIPFNIIGIPHDITADILSQEAGISVRNGCFCAQPYVQRLLKIPDADIQKFIRHPNSRRPGMVRLSFGLYNTFDEIDSLIQVLRDITGNKQDCLNKYKGVLNK